MQSFSRHTSASLYNSPESDTHPGHTERRFNSLLPNNAAAFTFYRKSSNSCNDKIFKNTCYGINYDFMTNLGCTVGDLALEVE